MLKRIFAILLFASLTMNAQEVIATQGDSYSNTNGSINFTIGEVIIQTITSGSNHLTQGFHQTNLTVLGVDDFANNLLVTVFPNPTPDILQVDIDKYIGLSFKVYDIQGRLLNQQKIDKKLTQINLTSYSKGLYLLTLYNEKNQKLKTYRIIKN